MIKKKKVRDRAIHRLWMQGTDLQPVAKTPIDNQRVMGDTERQLWYKARIKEASGRCVECNQRINYRDPASAYGSQAHLLPKELFPSVALHPLNNVELGRWCCHGQYDSSWLNASRMKVWPHALDVIVHELVPLLTRKEKSKLPDIILNSLSENP